MAAAVVQVRRACKTFGRHRDPVWRDVGFDIGPSGSGKSTLIRAIAGLVPIGGAGPGGGDAEPGRIDLFGVPMQHDGRIAGSAAKLRARVGVIFQQFNLVPRLSVLTNVCLGFLGLCPQWLVVPVRRMMDACRAIHEVVFAVMFVAAVGLGPFAGVLALAVHNLGVISKLFSETVEAIDPRPVEGIRATGAGPAAEVIWGVVPQVLPMWVSLTLYRLDTNVRSATTLGIVGAGGIGQTLFESIRSFQYAETAAQLVIIVVTVVVDDVVSARVRRSLV